MDNVSSDGDYEVNSFNKRDSKLATGTQRCAYARTKYDPQRMSFNI